MTGLKPVTTYRINEGKLDKVDSTPRVLQSASPYRQRKTKCFFFSATVGVSIKANQNIVHGRKTVNKSHNRSNSCRPPNKERKSRTITKSVHRMLRTIESTQKVSQSQCNARINVPVTLWKPPTREHIWPPHEKEIEKLVIRQAYIN